MKELWDQYHDKNLPKKLWDNEEFWSYEDKPQATRNLSGAFKLSFTLSM